MAEERSVYNPVTKERFVTGVTSADTGGAYVEGTALFPVGARPPGIHRHPHQDEQNTVVCLSGVNRSPFR